MFDVDSRIVIDNSRITPMNTMLHVAMMVLRSSGAVICRKAVSRDRAEDAGRLLQLDMQAPHRRLHLLEAGRHLQREKSQQH